MSNKRKKNVRNAAATWSLLSIKTIPHSLEALNLVLHVFFVTTSCAPPSSTSFSSSKETRLLRRLRKKISGKRIVCGKEKKKRNDASWKKGKSLLKKKLTNQKSSKKDRTSCQPRTKSTNFCARCIQGMMLSELLNQLSYIELEELSMLGGNDGCLICARPTSFSADQKRFLLANPITIALKSLMTPSLEE